MFLFCLFVIFEMKRLIWLLFGLIFAEERRNGGVGVDGILDRYLAILSQAGVFFWI